MKKIVPTIHAITAKDENNQVNLTSTLTATNAKFRALERAFWNCDRAITTDFMRLGALVKAYSKEVIEAKISARPTRMYGPETTQTLMGDGLGSGGTSFVSHSEGAPPWHGEVFSMKC